MAGTSNHEVKASNNTISRIFHYRVLRYLPNVVREEHLNIGVLIEDPATGQVGVRLIAEPHEFARIRSLHPEVDQTLLRGLTIFFEECFAKGAGRGFSHQFANLDTTLSNALQLSPARSTVATNSAEELARLYNDYVSIPYRVSAHIVEHARGWIKERVEDVFRRNQLLDKLSEDVSVETFTQRGDTFKFDYGYNSTFPGFIQVSSAKDIAQAKVLAFTAKRILARNPQARITAIIEESTAHGISDRFVECLFSDENIEIVRIDRVEVFAQELLGRLA
jgi:hypothetical protein